MIVLLVACTGSPKPADDPAAPRAPGPIRLYYMGSDALGDVGTATDPHRIYTASSSDGIHFVEEGQVFESAAGNDPDIFVIPGGYALFTSTGPELTLASSVDPLAPFTEVSVVSWYGGGGASTLDIGGVTQLFFCGDNGIKVAELSFSPPELSPHADALPNWREGRICDPAVLQFAEDDYRMFVHWSPALDAGPWRHVLYQATSTDGINYTPIDVPLYESASVPGAVAYEGVLYLYAVDAREGGEADSATIIDTAKPDDTSGLLVGISTDAGATFEFTEVVLEGAEARQGYDPDAMVVSSR